MYKNKSIIALIPARAGSKGILNKNIRDFCGKPLIAWTVQEAKKSKYIDRVVISTDSKKIAEIGKKFGAEVPFMRPKVLAADEALMSDVINHALGYFDEEGKPFDLLLLLQPTSPLRTAEDINHAIRMLSSKNVKAIVSVSVTHPHPLWSNVLPVSGSMKNFLRVAVRNSNRQALPVFYNINGAIYLSYADYFRKNNSFFGRETYAYIMPGDRSVDIDSRIDFELAGVLKCK